MTDVLCLVTGKMLYSATVLYRQPCFFMCVVLTHYIDECRHILSLMLSQDLHNISAAASTSAAGFVPERTISYYPAGSNAPILFSDGPMWPKFTSNPATVPALRSEIRQRDQQIKQDTAVYLCNAAGGLTPLADSDPLPPGDLRVMVNALPVPVAMTTTDLENLITTTVAKRLSGKLDDRSMCPLQTSDQLCCFLPLQILLSLKTAFVAGGKPSKC